MNIDALFHEIEGIDVERKRLQTELRKLNKRREDYLNRIVEYAQQKNVNTVSYKNKTYSIKPKTVYARKGEKGRKKDAIDALSLYVDKNEAEQVYDDITTALRGEERTKYVIGK